MLEPFNFNGSKALVIGGATGLGKEIAIALAGHGADVIIASRNIEKLKATSKNINSGDISGSCTYFDVDISSSHSIEQLVSNVSKMNDGKLNILVNSAGMNIRNPIEKISIDDWDTVMNANLKGAFMINQLSFKLLEKSEYGRVINITSIFSSVTYPERATYSASKGGLLMFSKTLALEWAKYNITVNTISPGPFLTEINTKVLEDKSNYEKFCSRIPMARFGEPKEIVTSALFLASPMSSYVTGTDLIIDGGWTTA
jgi:NAD(P)-dependent dehydrogenase (short-subunit alcohol dehydrogenase family)